MASLIKGSLQRFLLFIFVLSVVSFLSISVYTISQKSSIKSNLEVDVSRRLDMATQIKTTSRQKIDQVVRKTLQNATKASDSSEASQTNNNADGKNPVLPSGKGSVVSIPHANTTVDFNVHIFYYPWYKSEKVDGEYAHWNHQVIPDWHKEAKTEKLTRKRQYVPPDDIGANFYPKLGPYSSHDLKVLQAHMQQMRFMGTGVVCVSWYPPQYVKESETRVDDLMMPIFDMAAKYGLKVTFHIEPYTNRSGKSLQEVSKFIIDKYGSHPAFYRTNFKGRQLPVYYVYDSYQIPEMSWAQALKPNGVFSVRNTKYDALFLGLLVERKHSLHLTKSGFDGFYTYFASNGFTYGSSWINWHVIAKEAEMKNQIFSPSIGPGYLDTRVRPWNGQTTRLRLNGKYYRKSFYNALSTRPRFISITSFNEWHEGTQVEPAIPKVNKEGYRYTDYLPNTPEYYLNLTRQFVVEYSRNMTDVHHLTHHDAF